MNQETINKYSKLGDSLRRAQRAQLLNDASENIIEELYTDPLDNNFVLQTMLFNQTTLLIGRKGTGKTTIINRFQHEIRKTKEKISLYLDVNTLYDESFNSLPNINANEKGLSQQEIHKYQLYKHFLGKVINEIQQEINKNVFTNKLVKFFSGSGLTENEFKGELQKIYADINAPKYQDITALKEIKSVDTNKKSDKEENALTGEIEVKPKIEFGTEGAKLELGSVSLKASDSNSSGNEELTTKEYSTVLIRYFNLIEFINRVKELLRKVGINQVFICLDDSSELEMDALDVFVRTIVAPLHNSADGYFKFKISFYPGRDHLPDIDRGKIDLINLDYYDLYQSFGVDKVEELAISYTRRLIEGRFHYYLGSNVNMEDFFDTKNLSLDGYYRLIFQATSNVSRFIGKLFWYAGKKSISQGQKINKRILQDSAKEHYTSEIEQVLTKHEFFQYRDYNEKFEREHLKKLLDVIIVKAKENRRKISESEAEIFKEYSLSSAPSNYLYFPPTLEELISTLELNFFISKYTQQKDRGSGSGKNYVPPKDVSVFTLNYGLCQKENIIVDEKSDRKFRVERVFDYSDLIFELAKSSQIIKCSNCKTEYPLDKLHAIKEFGMLCVKCHQNTCEVVSVSIDIPEKNVPKIKEIEFQIMNALRIEDGLISKEIGEELDCSTQKIGALTRVDRSLRTSEYLEKDQQDKLHITQKALDIFFK